MPYKDPEAGKEHRREYYAENRERLKAQMRAYYLAHKEKWTLESHRRYRKEHPEAYHAERRRMKERKRNFILQRLGNKCANPYNLPHPDWCNDPRILEIAHINGEPIRTKKGKRRSLTGESYATLEEILPNLTLLCPNCHALSHLDENGRLQNNSRIH